MHDIHTKAIEENVFFMFIKTYKIKINKIALRLDNYNQLTLLKWCRITVGK